jgi:hypothetical protein
MFCPKCAAQNLDGASYCRVCGANISLVPQALTGQLPYASEEGLSRAARRARRRHREPGLDTAFKNAFMGVAFLLVAMALLFTGIGNGWWFWMLIPAFALMGTGIAHYIRYREMEKRQLASGAVGQPSIYVPPHVNSFPHRSTGEVVSQPASVTEGTTRHLGTEQPTRVLDPSAEPPK